MYIEMELLARERYETRLREAAEIRLNHGSIGSVPTQARSSRRLPLPRLRQR
jgi:hypothetical protein